MNAKFDVAVVGGGIVGLAHAWMAARRNLRVLLLERDPNAQGASVRNFGMIWPIGQPAGELHQTALRSRELWLELNRAKVVELEECGSLHLAHRKDEAAVLDEFTARKSHNVQLLSAEETLRRSPLANPSDLCCAMYSPSELRLDPRAAIPRIASWLAEQHGVTCRFGAPVSRVESGELQTADGERWQAERIIVCGGSDLRTLYPEILASLGLRLCKLQMLKTIPQQRYASGTPHIASGLTLRHYAVFADCTTLPALRKRIADETPELDRFGIHVMASQSPDGSVVLGDSHEYGEEITPFDKAEIDDLMLRELRKVIQLEDWTIGERWHGIYAKHPDRAFMQVDVAETTHLFTGIGGAGMTMSFGLAEKAWQKWTGEDA